MCVPSIQHRITHYLVFKATTISSFIANTADNRHQPASLAAVPFWKKHRTSSYTNIWFIYISTYQPRNFISIFFSFEIPQKIAIVGSFDGLVAATAVPTRSRAAATSRLASFINVETGQGWPRTLWLHRIYHPKIQWLKWKIQDRISSIWSNMYLYMNILYTSIVNYPVTLGCSRKASKPAFLPGGGEVFIRRPYLRGTQECPTQSQLYFLKLMLGFP